MNFRKVLRYRFDTFMAKGGISVFISLLFTFVIIFILLAAIRGCLVWCFPLETLHLQHDLDFWGNAYITFLELTDPGNMAQDISSSPWYKVVGIFAGISGVIMFSALIAFITTAMDQKLSELKRGHSKVIEEEHTLLLGWNEQRVVEIIRELIIANESERDACIVILADKDKEEMDDILRVRLPDTITTRIVTRSGNTSSLENLEIVSVVTCKSMIILAACDDMGSFDEKSSSDAKVIQTIMALTSIDKEDEDACIVAEIFNPNHRSIIEKTFADQVVIVDSGDILAKLLVQTSRSVGLSVVYNEILSFDGCEMYFYHANWKGVLFKDIGYRFPDGVPLGMRHANGAMTLNPDINYQLKDDDDILILADDDSTIDFLENPVATPVDLDLVDSRLEQRIEKELILGWTFKVPIILKQYSDYVKPGSKIDIMLESPCDDARSAIELANNSIDGIDINLLEKDRLDIDQLMSVNPYSYDNIIILAEGGGDNDAQKVDSENIITLILLRYISENYGMSNNKDTKLITEILDSQNYPLISQAGVKDVIISNRLISMILAQISENKNIKEVYDDIFEESGSEIYLKPAHLYFHDFPVEVTFATIMRITQLRKEVCLGIKIKSLENDSDNNYGIDLIPDKNSIFTLNAEDSMVVLSEDEF